MKIKEILPFTIDTPVIHLVQPSPTIPLGHEVVFQQNSGDGGGVNPIYALAAQEKRRKQKIVQENKKEFKEKEKSNLSCGFISPPIHPAVDQKKVKSSFYDLRNNRSMSIAVDNEPKLSPTLSARSKSLEDSPKERRKKGPDFEDILRELGCSSRTSDAGESTTSKASSGESETCKDVTRKCSIASSDSVFYDISLDDPEIERSNTSPAMDLTPRKSFSEETFDRNHTNMYKNRTKILDTMKRNWRTISSDSCDESYDEAWNNLKTQDKRRVSQMVDDLLLEIYGDKSMRPVRRRSITGITRGRSPALEDSHYDSLYEDNTCCTEYTSGSEGFRLAYLQQKSVPELVKMVRSLQADVKRLGGRLVKQLVRRDCLIAKRDWHCNWITAYLQANSEKRSEDTKTRFSVAPGPGDSGFTQWQNGMRMVARLPEGIPPQFRKTLWLNLAEKHLASRGVQWPQVEEFCFNEFTNPDDEELGVQIVKDVHRTGCSLFCGVSGKDNQALLKRVLLAYARWNKAVGYCQGFNMLAALILQVMDKSEVDSVKVMIYLIEGVLPESYFANNLRGLSVDMAVFRDLLRIKLPTLSRHFDQLQCDSKDSGTSYEPPLTNVFTMQWFLTLFCNCLPQDTVLRVWDLIFLEGNHILLSTALAIWSTLSDRIMTVESADEFYSIMGVLTREMLEFGLMDANALIKAIVSFNLPELPELREKYLYNITPWTQSVSTVARRGLRLFYSDDDTDTEEDDEKIAIATAYGLFRSPKRKDGATGVTSPPRAISCPDKEKIAMDISALTKQYRKLRERQKQAHVILTAACGSQSLVGPTTSPAMNHLLMGKFALVNNKGRRLGPPPGSIPPPSQPRPKQGEKQTITISGETLHWKDTMDGKKTQQRDSDEDQSPEQSSRRSSSSSTSTELCDDPQRSPSDSEDLSDASAFLPSDTESSTPKRSVQPKLQHPSDIISCKEVDEEAYEKNLEEKHIPQMVLEVKHNESNKSCKSLSPASIKSLSPVSSEGDEERLQKRKLSFRIDPEELRQLDRKLSLKIVEIERRKSSAGIESEDLNSKVLFPFDRDYIHEMEKCDRDTPSSIPDDRMCSTEDYISSFEEETILVPDIITIHKPLGYRMASVEECDETKISESYDETECNVAENMMAENNTDEIHGSMDYEIPTELDEGEEEDVDDDDDDDNEEDSQIAYASYNFDELFISNDAKNHKDLLEPRIEKINLDYYGQDESNVSETSLTHNQNVLPLTSSQSTTEFGQTTDKPSTSHILPEISCLSLSEKQHDTNIISFESSLYLSDDMKARISVTESVRNDQCSSADNHPKVLKSEYSDSQLVDNTGNNNVVSYLHRASVLRKEGSVNFSKEDTEFDSINKTTHGINTKTSPNMSDSEKALERKLVSVLPKIASLSFDSNMPDVAAVASREACINSIREKYANLSQTSIDESQSEDYRYSHSLKCDTNTDPGSNTDKENLELKFIDGNFKEEGSFIISSLSVNAVSCTQETIEQSASKTNKSSDITEVQNTVVKLSLVEKENEQLLHDTKAHLIKKENDKLEGKKEEKEVNQQIFHDEEIRRPSSASSNRRGSEVALSLILKENSQILSKIQQQSRRSSEVNFDQTPNLERFLKSESPKENIEEKTKTSEEILSLTKAILNIDSESSKSFKMNDREPDEQNDLSTVDTRLSPKLCTPVVSEGQLNSSSETLENKNISKEHNEKTETEVVEKISKNQETFKEFSFTEKIESLPDVCKFNTDLSKISKHKSTASSSDKFQPYLSSRLNSDDVTTDANTSEYTVKTFKDPYSYSKRPSIMSPTTEVDENSPPEVSSLSKFKSSSIEDEPIISSLISKEQPLSLPVTSMLSQASDLLKVESSSTELDSLSDTNEDILKELRALNIKPEEVLEYTDSKVIPITPVTPEDFCSTHKRKPPIEDTIKLSVADEKYDFNKYSSDSSSEFRTSRHCFHTDYKTSSFDIVSSTKMDSYSTERHRPIVRSATTVDNDNLLYLSSYKSHGRLLIEKGELDPYKNLDMDKSPNFSGKDPDSSPKFSSKGIDLSPKFSGKDTESSPNFNSKGIDLPSKFSGKDPDNYETTRSSERKSLNIDEESAYDYKRVNSSRVHRSYSEFLADDTRSSIQTKTEPREKTLFKYKSEDYGRSMSPPHYRFSSASPVRKRLDHFPTDSPSPYSSLARAKSPSPTYYGSSQSLSSVSSRSPEQSGIDSPNKLSTDCRRYSRTESLDLNRYEIRSAYSKKRTESLDITTPDKLTGDKKSPSSPQKFNPFPVRSSSRQPKELGVKLGLYLPQKSEKSPSKHVT